MMEIEHIIEELKDDFEAIAMARPPFVLEKFVVGAHDHPAQQWAHCVLEMKNKFNAIRRAKIQRQIIQVEIKQLREQEDEISLLKAQLKEIDLDEQERVMLGAAREFEALYEIYKRFGNRYSREELNEFQAEYWRLRLTRQAEQDLRATGHVSQGNQDALRQIGIAEPGENKNIGQVQQNYLSQGNRRMLIVTATEKKAENGLPNLTGLIIPETIEQKIQNIYGMSTDAAYNEAVLIAMREGCDYLLLSEDDTFPPPSGLITLLNHDIDIVGGWYPKRRDPIEGVPIIIREGQRQGLNEPDGKLHEVYTIPQGFTLFKVDVFRHIKHPWFVTTAQLSQDSFFSQKAREAGFKLWCDTSIRCKHIDRTNGKVYQ